MGITNPKEIIPDLFIKEDLKINFFIYSSPKFCDRQVEELFRNKYFQLGVKKPQNTVAGIHIA
jgi:hypothetical protein